MNREKQIEKMAKYCHFYEDGNCTLGEELGVACDNQCDMYEFAKRLYNAGYRKTSEVAEEIFEEIERAFIKYYDERVTYGSPILPYHIRNAVGFSLNEMFMEIEKLKKKYTEGEK